MAKQFKFKKSMKVVYPAHGVGEIKGIETQTVVGTEISTYVVQFEKEKMVLRIPVHRAENNGLRHLCTEKEIESVRKTLAGRPKTSRGMWSRRAKEYEAKINSGDIVFVAEVLRDLHKNVDDPDRSYSERIIYESALDRIAGEISAIRKIDLKDAQAYLVKTINDNNPQYNKKAATKKKGAANDDVDAEAEDIAA
jgi:CarD family transcriptional regulator